MCCPSNTLLLCDDTEPLAVQATQNAGNLPCRYARSPHHTVCGPLAAAPSSGKTEMGQWCQCFEQERSAHARMPGQWRESTGRWRTTPIVTVVQVAALNFKLKLLADAGPVRLGRRAWPSVLHSRSELSLVAIRARPVEFRNLG